MRAAMERMGWTSVAGRVVSKDFRDARLLIGGTESPWAGEHPPMEAAPAADDAVRAANDFRLLLSHAPHLIRWARQRRIDLLLAGHLHGGQIQWPIIGPIAGGRFHSGLFDLPPTLMHVGRGLGQMAPIRWGCGRSLQSWCCGTSSTSARDRATTSRIRAAPPYTRDDASTAHQPRAAKPVREGRRS
jgi:hypothetical protein